MRRCCRIPNQDRGDDLVGPNVSSVEGREGQDGRGPFWVTYYDVSYPQEAHHTPLPLDCQPHPRIWHCGMVPFRDHCLIQLVHVLPCISLAPLRPMKVVSLFIQAWRISDGCINPARDAQSRICLFTYISVCLLSSNFLFLLLASYKSFKNERSCCTNTFSRR
jgi:hypothetical protein